MSYCLNAHPRRSDWWIGEVRIPARRRKKRCGVCHKKSRSYAYDPFLLQAGKSKQQARVCVNCVD